MVAAVVRWSAFAVLLALLVVHVVGRGPLRLRAPATVLSNSHPFQKAGEPYLLFLRALRAELPEGATIVVVGAQDVDPILYVALGQLPRQRLLSPAVLRAKGARILPRFVAAYGGEIADPRYGLKRRFPRGDLYEARR